MRAAASLHLWSFFGHRSQVWLYRLLGGMRRYPPHLLLRKEWDAQRDPAEFPWPAERLHRFPPRALPARAAAKAVTFLRCGRADVLNALDARFVRRLAARLESPVVHVHFGWLARAILGGRPDFGVPAIVSLYGSDVFRAAGPYRRQLAALLSRPDLWLVVTSEAIAVAARELGAAPERTAVIPVGIAAASLPAEAEVCQARAQRAGNGPLRLITVGRFIPCRAHADLADVARQLAAQGLDFRWILVGDGTEVARFEDRAQSLGVRDRFELTGSLPFAAVQELLIAADIMVLNAVIAPSGEREALGVSLIEGSALGLPVVSCRVGGIPEIVTDGETGFLVAAGDATALAERILQLARDPDLRLQLGAAAMARARQRFSSERLAAQLEAFYDRVRGLRASA